MVGTTALAHAEGPVYQGEPLKDLMKRVMQFQIKAYEGKYPVNWQAATFWAGVTQAWKSTGDEAFHRAAMTWGQGAKWKPSTRPYHADDVAVGQSYIDLYLHDKDPRMIEQIKPVLESYLGKKTVRQSELRSGRRREPDNEIPFTGRNVWWWCDALFMGPPTLARMAQVDGDKRYLSLLHSFYWDSVDLLLDKEENLFFRDANNFPAKKKTPSGKKIFWGRGNGWVYGGLIRTLDALPVNDPQREKYVELFRKMTPAIVKWQGEDGCWRVCMNDPEWIPDPETSGTAFFCYGLLAGINRGYIDRATYLPKALKAWDGLLSHIDSDGRLDHSQQEGSAPTTFKSDTFKDYTNGAFLLAGSELYVMKLSPQDLRK
jgi:rhamnogalacturonyl hydrolase YesR